jgi:signal peptidase II
LRISRALRVFWPAIALIALDQASKLYIRGLSVPMAGSEKGEIVYGQSIHLLGSWLNITFIENPAMAFGLDFIGKIALALIALTASIGVIAYLLKRPDTPFVLRTGLILVLAGAFGNFLDRTFYGILFGYGSFFQGNVVDFIDLDLFMIHFGSKSFKVWPIFNVADAAITVGVVFLVLANYAPNLMRRHKAEDVQPGVPEQTSEGAETSASHGSGN